MKIALATPLILYHGLKILLKSGKITSARLLFLLASLTSSCSWLAPEEKPAAYISIDSIGLSVNNVPFTESAAINDAWVYVDNKLIGVFELPAKRVPIPQLGKARLKILPGVVSDGVRNLRVWYPFFTAFETDIMLEKGQSQHFSFNTSYATDSIVKIKLPPLLHETFEGGLSLAMVAKANSAGRFIRKEYTNAERYPGSGNYYGILEYSGLQDTSIAIISTRSVVVERGRNTAYLELNYRCNVAFRVGILAEDVNGREAFVYDLSLRPTNTWRKVYVFLTDEYERAYSVNLANPKILLEADVPGNFESFIAIDNVRLITFE